MDYERLYSYRFEGIDQAQRNAVWRQIAPFVTERMLGKPRRLLDPAAGRREFIDAAPAQEKWAIDAADHGEGADPSVRMVVSDVMTAELPESYFDGIFVSNFLEHLPSQEVVHSFLEKMFAATAPGGRIAVMGPNFRYCKNEYFDMADHTVVLTHLATAEHLHWAGFRVQRAIPRFLPYSFRSRLPASPALTRRYLRTPPLWRLFGQQFLLVGER